MTALAGELTFASLPQRLRGDLSGVKAQDGALDLAGVTRIDSAGAAFLLQLARDAGKDQKLTLLNAHPQTIGLLRFFELDDVFVLPAR